MRAKKNSILTSSEWLLSCHKSDYLHPRRAGRANVRVINNSRQLAGGSTGGERVHGKKEVRGKAQFILVLTSAVIFFYSVGSGVRELSTPSRLSQQGEFTGSVLNNQGLDHS